MPGGLLSATAVLVCPEVVVFQILEFLAAVATTAVTSSGSKCHTQTKSAYEPPPFQWSHTQKLPFWYPMPHRFTVKLAKIVQTESVIFLDL